MIEKYLIANPEFLINSDEEKQVIENCIKDLNTNKKGVLIHGLYGTGKTMFLKGYIKYLESVKYYPPQIISIEKIISNILSGKLPKIENRALIIDEFGAELDKNLVHFGTSIKEIIINFMLLRYELYQDTGIKTSISTNLSPYDIPEIYGVRIADRFAEMLNIHHFNWQSKRK